MRLESGKYIALVDIHENTDTRYSIVQKNEEVDLIIKYSNIFLDENIQIFF